MEPTPQAMSATRPEASTPLRVLFVCTANIARSPYAERRAVALLAEAGASGEVEVASAGVPGWAGRSMDEDMGSLVRARGGAADGHTSRAVDEDLLAWADLVLTFEFTQHMRLLDQWPQYRDRILGFGQAVAAASSLPRRWTDDTALAALADAAGPDSMSYDVDDPYRRGARAAASCADQIDGGLAVLVPFLVDAARGRSGQTAVAAPEALNGAVRPLAADAAGTPAGQPGHGGQGRPRRKLCPTVVVSASVGSVFIMGGGAATVATIGTTTSLWGLAVVALGAALAGGSALWHKMGC